MVWYGGGDVMLYDDNLQRYHSADDVEELYEQYEDEGGRMPEVLYEVKAVEVKRCWAETLAAWVVEWIDEGFKKMSTEEDRFSDRLSAERHAELVEILHGWMVRACDTVEPDYDKPVAFREGYLRWLAEQKPCIR